jgi:hypothetical protein
VGIFMTIEPAGVRRSFGERVTTGFHRTGLILGGAVAALGVGLATVAGLSGSASREPLFGYVVGFGLAGLLVYGLARGAAWVIVGFSPEPPALRPAHRDTQVDRAPRGDLVGVKGWLILPAIGTVLSPLYAVAGLAAFINGAWGADISQPKVAVIVAVYVTTYTLLFAACCYLVFLFWKKRRAYIRWFVGVSIASVVIGIGSLVHASLMGVHLEPGDASSIASSSFWGILWSIYMLRSRRAKNTFCRSPLGLDPSDRGDPLHGDIFDVPDARIRAAERVEPSV